MTAARARTAWLAQAEHGQGFVRVLLRIAVGILVLAAITPSAATVIRKSWIRAKMAALSAPRRRLCGRCSQAPTKRPKAQCRNDRRSTDRQTADVPHGRSRRSHEPGARPAPTGRILPRRDPPQPRGLRSNDRTDAAEFTELFSVRREDGERLSRLLPDFPDVSGNRLWPGGLGRRQRRKARKPQYALDFIK